MLYELHFICLCVGSIDQKDLLAIGRYMERNNLDKHGMPDCTKQGDRRLWLMPPPVSEEKKAREAKEAEEAEKAAKKQPTARRQRRSKAK